MICWRTFLANPREVLTAGDAGVEEIEYKVYSGATHEITQDMREDFRAWLLNFVSKGTTA